MFNVILLVVPHLELPLLLPLPLLEVERFLRMTHVFADPAGG
jgi:hypothetical protein